jgi:hypothetical protein
MGGVSEAFVAAMNAIASVIPERPLPKGINVARVGNWVLTLNASAAPIEHDGQELAPFTILATHNDYLIICVLAPDGGIVGGGMTEGEFIEEMKALTEQVPA